MSGNIEVKFLVGLPRSGSTLWSHIIDKDDEHFCFEEMLFLSPWRKDIRNFKRKYAGDLSENSNLQTFVDALVDRKKNKFLRGNFWFQLSKVQPDVVARRIYDRLLPTERSLGDVFRAIIEEACAVRGYQRCVVKFPVHVIQLAKLREWYPAATIINITRDPRAIAASKTNDPGGTGKLIKRWPALRLPLRIGAEMFVIMQYILAARVHDKYRNSENYRLFYYEQLVTSPDSVIKQLCEFANFGWSESMLDPRSGESSSLSGEKRGGIDARSMDRWKSALTSTESSVVNFMTRGAQLKYGFDHRNYKVTARV